MPISQNFAIGCSLRQMTDAANRDVGGRPAEDDLLFGQVTVARLA